MRTYDFKKDIRDCDIVQIEEHNDGKYIHLLGYFYEEEHRTYLSYNFAFIKLDEFEKADEGERIVMISDCEIEAKQGIEYINLEINEQAKQWFVNLNEISLMEIGTNTPCGTYVIINK